MYFNSYLRADVTFDIRNEVEGRVLSTEQVAGDNGTTWTRTTEDHIVSRDNTILANVYVDIPAWARFRPYIGAGAGVAVHRMHRTYGLRVDCTVIPVPGTDCFNGNGPIIDGQGNLATADAREKDWQFGFAGALMAGGVVDLSENWKLDVGYRFLHLTSVGFSHPISGTQVGAPVATTGTVKIPDQNIHEFRVGLRYDIY
jgi:opacity protein-like surface antigen